MEVGEPVAQPDWAAVLPVYLTGREPSGATQTSDTQLYFDRSDVSHLIHWGAPPAAKPPLPAPPSR